MNYSRGYDFDFYYGKWGNNQGWINGYMAANLNDKKAKIRLWERLTPEQRKAVKSHIETFKNLSGSSGGG